VSCKICLDTNVLLSFLSASKHEDLRLIYEKSKKDQNFVFSNWTYLLFTGETLIISPLSTWEFTVNRKGACSVSDLLNFIDYLKNRFGASTQIDPMTLALSYLFATATSIPCDDSYHFIHAIRNSADFFATGDKDFKAYKEERKDENIAMMKEILQHHNPIASIKKEIIEEELIRVSKLTWARIIREPIEVPTMITL